MNNKHKGKNSFMCNSNKQFAKENITTVTHNFNIEIVQGSYTIPKLNELKVLWESRKQKCLLAAFVCTWMSLTIW